jgi:predicted N-acetyltransferase YhbS
MAPSIRTAGVIDASEIAALTAQLGYEVTASAVAARLSRILARSDQQFLVAEVEGRPVAWIHMALSEIVESEPFVMIAGLVVDRQNRGNGIGRLLVAQAEKWTREQGCSIVRLSSSATRAAAHQFYEALGYTNIKTQYSFLKMLDGSGAERFSRFVPAISP